MNGSLAGHRDGRQEPQARAEGVVRVCGAGAAVRGGFPQVGRQKHVGFPSREAPAAKAPGLQGLPVKPAPRSACLGSLVGLCPEPPRCAPSPCPPPTPREPSLGTLYRGCEATQGKYALLPPSSATAEDAQAGVPCAPRTTGGPRMRGRESCSRHPGSWSCRQTPSRQASRLQLHRGVTAAQLAPGSHTARREPEAFQPAHGHQQAQPPAAAALPTAASGCPARTSHHTRGTRGQHPFLRSLKSTGMTSRLLWPGPLAGPSR